jgi:hypothetical protein
MGVRARQARQPATDASPVAVLMVAVLMVAVIVAVFIAVMIVSVVTVRAATVAHAVQHGRKIPLQHINDNYPDASANGSRSQ